MYVLSNKDPRAGVDHSPNNAVILSGCEKTGFPLDKSRSGADSAELSDLTATSSGTELRALCGAFVLVFVAGMASLQVL